MGTMQLHCRYNLVFNMQVETRFGSRVMVCRDVLDSAEALQRAVNDSSFQINDAGAQVCDCRNIALFNLFVALK